MLCSHEIPTSLLEMENNGLDTGNDYLFFLLHRYIDDDRYRSAVDSSNKMKIMDNSCFELGESMSGDLIEHYANISKADFVVFPDVMGNAQDTLFRSLLMKMTHPALVHKGVFVIQGKSIDEMVQCYQIFNQSLPLQSIIGIPFYYNWKLGSPDREIAMERVKLMDKLSEVVNKHRRHHLLGTFDPIEFMYYKDYSWIYSTDTSNPVALALDGYTMTNPPEHTKPKIKFDQYADIDLKDVEIKRIIQNINTFKNIVNSGDNLN